MKSIKYKILMNFCLIAAVNIGIIVAVVSWKLDQSIAYQSERMSSSTTVRIYDTLKSYSDMIAQDLCKDIQRIAALLVQHPKITSALEANHTAILQVLLEEVVRRDNIDFLLIFNAKQQLQASFPASLDDLAVEKYFTTWDENTTSTQDWSGLLKLDAPMLATFGLADRDISGKGALSITTTRLVKNDFGEPLGMCILGKLLNNYPDLLKKHLQNIADVVSVIYLDTVPIVQTGFEGGSQKNPASAVLSMRPEVQTEIYQKGRQNLLLTFTDQSYLTTCTPLAALNVQSAGILCIGMPEAQLRQTQQALANSGNLTKKNLQEWIAGIGMLSLILFAVMSLVIAARIVVPLKHLSDHAKMIARGDFEHSHFMVKSHDEIEELSDSLTDVAASFQAITATSEAISHGNLHHKVMPRSDRDMLGHSLQRMSAYLHQTASVAEAVADGDLTDTIQLRSADDVFGRAMQSMMDGLYRLVEQIKTSAEQITSTGTTILSLASENIRIVNNVHDSMELMALTMNDTGYSAEDVVKNVNTLYASTEETTASVSQMTASISQITSNITNLTSHTHQIGDFIEEAMQALQGIIASTDLSKQLSEGTSREALKGQEAVDEVMNSMETIQRTVTMAVDSITGFAERSEDISTVIDVIQDITEQTALLALNAAIIAAQAGEHGKGFAVVASEMKSLASGVETSTKTIADIVRKLQQDTAKVVKTIYKEAEEVKQGMERTLQAKKILKKIISSAEQASTEVVNIAKTLHGMLNTSQKISSAIAQINTMTDEIMNATKEQLSSTHQINDTIAHINDMTSQIHGATVQQLAGVKKVLDVTEDVSALIDHNLESSQQVMHTTDHLSSQAELLLQSVARFKMNSPRKQNALEINSTKLLQERFKQNE